MIDRTWTYEEVTAAAEKTIGRLMTTAAEKPDTEKAHYELMAWGAYSLWASMTVLGQTPEDSRRLMRLAGASDLLSDA